MSAGTIRALVALDSDVDPRLVENAFPVGSPVQAAGIVEGAQCRREAILRHFGDRAAPAPGRHGPGHRHGQQRLTGQQAHDPPGC